VSFDIADDGMGIQRLGYFHYKSYGS